MFSLKILLEKLAIPTFALQKLKTGIMVVERTTDEIVVRLPSTLNVESIQRFLNYLLFKETVQKSLAIQEEIDELAREVNKSWWKKNKIKYLPEE